MGALKPFLVENGKAVLRSRIPHVSFEEFRTCVLNAVQQGARVSSFFGMETSDSSKSSVDGLQVLAVLVQANDQTIAVLSTSIGKTYPALTPECPQVHLFERELAEQFGVTPEGHPWPRPARFQPPLRGVAPARDQLPSVADFFRIEGEEVHEVAVGPVHAGVIEPGHFRFQCHGEKVFHLEISLGYQHRGIERAILGGPHKRTLFQMETAAGDTTVGHTLAYCQNTEALTGCDVSPRAQAIRAVGLELERLANHTGDLGALGGDVGFLPTSSYCGRIRGDFLNMSALLCGSRLGRGLVRCGGVGFDLDSPERLDKLGEALSRAEEDTRVAIQLLWDTPAVLSRFEQTGTVSRETAIALGLVGPAARASGIDSDTRLDFPSGQYRVTRIPRISGSENRSGDVAARAWVRWDEMQSSFRFFKELLPSLPAGSVLAKASESGSGHLQADALVVSLVEGWRGEICHVAITDAQGRFARYKIVDPSFHNWIGLGMALRHQAISDFPLCNKSFNLSYCGFDL